MKKFVDFTTEGMAGELCEGRTIEEKLEIAKKCLLVLVAAIEKETDRKVLSVRYRYRGDGRPGALKIKLV